ncbi:hypothetical protein LI129_19520, partial [Erysipelatoclostridium ramosum]|uniref:hypothetical protein n=1 Tax=Thomasclavelia ramosa TaxID=1547 RepID=UPI001D072C1C
YEESIPFTNSWKENSIGNGMYAVSAIRTSGCTNKLTRYAKTIYFFLKYLQTGKFIVQLEQRVIV